MLLLLDQNSSCCKGFGNHLPMLWKVEFAATEINKIKLINEIVEQYIQVKH